MNPASKRWYDRWWAYVLALLLGTLVGWLLKGCYLDGWSGLNL